MVSVEMYYQNCEKCGEDSGLECLQTRTNDESFDCEKCGWFWESTSRKFGQGLLVVLEESFKGCNRCAWESVDPLLAGLLVECRINLHEDDSLLAQIEELLEKQHVNRTEADWDMVVRLSQFSSLFVMPDGRQIFDEVEGYRNASVAPEPDAS